VTIVSSENAAGDVKDVEDAGAARPAPS